MSFVKINRRRTGKQIIARDGNSKPCEACFFPISVFEDKAIFAHYQNSFFSCVGIHSAGNYKTGCVDECNVVEQILFQLLIIE